MRALSCFMVVVPALLIACQDDVSGTPALSCDLPHTGRVLAGEWSLTGEGKRTNCDDRRLEGSLKLESSMPIEVTSKAQATTGPATGPTTGSVADAFVMRIRRADYELALAPGAPKELALTGSAVGSCVGFSLTEELEDGDALHYEFNGYITGGRFVRGDFSGHGPESCEVEGTFELLIE